MTDSCPPDDELLAAATDDAGATDVLRHAAGCRGCGDRIAELRLEVGALRSFSRLSLPSAAVAGTQMRQAQLTADSPQHERIGRYIVVDKLGSGGQADVYRVIDPDLARTLVLKLSRRAPGGDDADCRQAVAEGKLLAALDHPGLVRVFDAGVCNGRPYLVLEYVPGKNLEQCYPRQRPKARESARLAGEVARALAYAHRHGVVHGDVTPRNVMISADGHTRLIDFGLARLEHVWHDGADSSGGTPAFVPPEMLLPDDQRHVGPAIDVFGLGGTLYWLLTGRGPFEAETVAQSLARARQGEVDFTLLRVAGAPRGLTRLCQQMLARDPALRPTAAECATRLQRAARRLPAMRSKAALILMLLVAVLLLESARWRPNKTVVLSVPDVMVIRDNELVNLKTVLPLRTGEPFLVSFLVAPDEEVTTVWLDSEGRAERLLLHRTKESEVDVLQYPDRPATMRGPPGTNMFFVCRGKPIGDADLQACFPHEPPPPIPNDVFLQLQRLRTVAPMGHIPPHSPESEAVARASDHMLDIDARLRRHFEGVRGVAFTVDGSPAAKSNSVHD
jgi:serine/threonine protein kinase